MRRMGTVGKKVVQNCKQVVSMQKKNLDFDLSLNSKKGNK